MRHLTAITVCIDFSDFLSDALPENRGFFDRYILLTSPEDTATQELGEKYDCEVITTTLHRDLGKFNKGAVINQGIASAHPANWLCLIDADIVLPTSFRTWLSELPKIVRKPHWVPHTLFGLHRLRCLGRENWLAYLQDTTVARSWPIEKLRKQNQCPVGYLQLWDAESSPHVYPTDCPTASRSDLVFAKKFRHCYHTYHPRAIHLETAKPSASYDYEGRRSPRWKDTSKMEGYTQ